jgi:ribosomal protein RSM22 (predicted rRNA methylase)
MQLPFELQAAINEILEKTNPTILKKARHSLTQDYKSGSISHFNDEAKRLAYLGARLPATFASVHKVLQNIPSLSGHVLDLGAGPGTASWAVADLFPEVNQFTLIEKISEAILLGKSLAKHHPLLQKSTWIHQSLGEKFPSADAAILSYVLNELNDPLAIVKKCWESVSLLIIIEPGTPKGFHLIRKIREQLIELNAHLIAPCPHSFACPVQGNDWCHFSARVERTRLHRLIKEGTLGHEDEKFSYLVASKSSGPVLNARIIRHPLKNSGHVRLSLCSNTGKIEEKVITRSDKESYRKARDADWGDPF